MALNLGTNIACCNPQVTNLIHSEVREPLYFTFWAYKHMCSTLSCSNMQTKDYYHDTYHMTRKPHEQTHLGFISIIYPVRPIFRDLKIQLVGEHVYFNPLRQQLIIDGAAPRYQLMPLDVHPHVC